MPKKYQLESTFQKDLLKRLKTIKGAWFYAPPTRSVRGIPDILGCVNGRFVALELKRLKAVKDPSREKLQAYVCAQIRKAGGFAWERVTPGNIETIFNLIAYWVSTLET